MKHVKVVSRTALMGSVCLVMLNSAQADTTPENVTSNLMSAESESVGDIHITAIHDGVLIRAKLSGMEPAGGHIAGGATHGLLSEQPTHPGDMPNIHVPESGNLTVEVVNTHLSILPDDSERTALLDEDGAA